MSEKEDSGIYDLQNMDYAELRTVKEDHRDSSEPKITGGLTEPPNPMASATDGPQNMEDDDCRIVMEYYPVASNSTKTEFSMEPPNPMAGDRVDNEVGNFQQCGMSPDLDLGVQDFLQPFVKHDMNLKDPILLNERPLPFEFLGESPSSSQPENRKRKSVDLTYLPAKRQKRLVSGILERGKPQLPGQFEPGPSGINPRCCKASDSEESEDGQDGQNGQNDQSGQDIEDLSSSESETHEE